MSDWVLISKPKCSLFARTTQAAMCNLKTYADAVIVNLASH